MTDLVPLAPAAVAAATSGPAEHSHGPWQCHDCWGVPAAANPPVYASYASCAYPTETDA